MKKVSVPYLHLLLARNESKLGAEPVRKLQHVLLAPELLANHIVHSLEQNHQK